MKPGSYEMHECGIQSSELQLKGVKLFDDGSKLGQTRDGREYAVGIFYAKDQQFPDGITSYRTLFSDDKDHPYDTPIREKRAFEYIKNHEVDEDGMFDEPMKLYGKIIPQFVDLT